MTHNVADNVLGKIARQQNDLFRRVREGSLNPEVISVQLQKLIQGVATIPIRPWIVVNCYYMGGCIPLEEAIRNRTEYSFSTEKEHDLSIGIGSAWWDVTLVKLWSSDLNQKGKSACAVSMEAQMLGLKLCKPDVAMYFCLNYNLKLGQRLMMPLYGYENGIHEPKQCAEFRYKPEGSDRHQVRGVNVQECGVGEDLSWIFELNKKWARPENG